MTDSYYRITQIEKILQKCHLTGYKGMLVSCEYGVGKQQRLFERLIDDEGNKKYLHLGNDVAADVEAARMANMDTCHIYSGEELLDAVGYMGMETYMHTQADRDFLSLIVEDPFFDRMTDIKDMF